MPAILKCLALAALTSLAVASPTPQDQAPQDQSPDPFGDNDDCSANTMGNGPMPDSDTPEDFLAYQPFKDTALNATVPYGYTSSFVDRNATVWNNKTFLDFNELTTYDVDLCAFQCNAIPACNAFTIYFERNPIMASTTRINCNLYSGGIDNDDDNFPGLFEDDFQIVIAGSNAYEQIINITLPQMDGYKTDGYTSGGAIEAPLDCYGNDTYLGVAKWYDGVFDSQRCVDLCTANSLCHFVNTYFQNLNDVPYTQHCALYTVHWPSWYATNVGQVRGANDVSINETSSFGFTVADGKDYQACEPFSNLPHDNEEPDPDQNIF